MDFRTIVGFILLAAIYFIFFAPTPPADNLKDAAERQETGQSQTTEAKDRPSQDPRVTGETSVPSKPKADEVIGAELQREFQLENNKVILTVNRLGEVQAVRLKNYFETAEGEEPIDWRFDETQGLNASYLEVNGLAPIWRPVPNDQPNILELFSNVEGAEINRRIKLLPDSFVLEVEDSIKNTARRTARTAKQVLLKHSTEGAEEPSIFSMFAPMENIKNVVVWNDGSVWRELFNSVETTSDFDKPIHWSGFSYKYFFLGAVPENVSIDSVKAARQGKNVEVEMQLAQKQIPSGDESSYLISYYLGPKDIEPLSAVSPDLEQAIDYGDWIGPISLLLLKVLHFFHAIIPNYGVGIILLTFVVKALLFPLAYKAAASMRKLSIVQPRMKEIRDKYKDDKQRMQSEMMALYRDEKVNPIGGCLPMLLQFPIFIALYRLFFASIEMRHEPFFGWIQDLSVHDPWFITPVLMTILMWGQQKITPMPTATDDNEAVKIQMAMMKWMPLIFGVVMLWLPAGLTLYFLVNAAISVGQQYYLNKHLDKTLPRPEPATAKVANGN